MMSKRSGVLSLNTLSNNLLAPLCRNLVIILALTIMAGVAAQPLQAANDWSASEGETIRNGLDPGDTFPDQSGELSVRYNNSGGGTTFKSSTNVADTQVTHLSEVKYQPSVSPVQFVGPGDTVTLPVRLWNTGNGPDTYSIRQRGPIVNSWDTGVFLDTNENGELESGEPEITDLAEVSNVASLDTSHIILAVSVPQASDMAQRDTFSVFSQSTRSSDPTPGQDTTHMVVQTDTSSVDVSNPNPPFDFVDTQTITNDTTVSLRFPAIKNVQEQNVTYVDPAGTQAQTGFHSHVNGDSEWTLTNREGQHKFVVQYEFNNGSRSDTYTDSIVLDHSAPTDREILIENGAETVASREVKLDPVSASDSHWTAGNGTGRIIIDNDSSFATVNVDTSVTPTGDRSGDSWVLTTEGIVFARYIDAAGNVSPVASDTVQFDFNTVRISRKEYVGLRAEATLTVNDFGANEDGFEVDDTSVRIVSDLDDEGITVRVTETAPNSGQFKGTFRFTEGFSDDAEDRIFVDPGSTVTARYVDSSNNLSSDTATWTRDSATATSVDDVRTWPNPFRPLEGEPFVFQNLPADQGMEITIFNVSGQLVRRLTVGRGIEFNPNGNVARWFGRNDQGDMLASGTYIYVVKSQFGTKRGKLTLVK